ncbi:hypothetical protein C1645_877063 [Glomus cerebriforme]|uniref:Uncharacterized protein n=1 Tax=Glomus cerebriforme TaxID=658196 RepID=A0A397SY27_9GLOM|nr:hypothetical protein C1645_877063 [Glomus cerebriforme]
MTKTFPPEFLEISVEKQYKTNLSSSSQSTNPELINDCHCSKEKRQSQATNLLMTYISIKYYDELIKEGIIDTKSKNTLFNYLEFLNVLNLQELLGWIG